MNNPPSSSFLLSASCCFFLLRITLVFSAPLPLQLISLLALKSSLKDPLSTLHGWDPTPSLSTPAFHRPLWCSWSGVKCDPKTSHVTSLDLSRRNLSGTIPPEIRYLSTLNHLNLSGNAFDGPFPPSVFELPNLRALDISHNNFNSSFPPGLSKIKFLRLLDAYSNSFTGPSLRTSSSSATSTGNALDGPIPPELGLNAQLQRLEIGYNAFYGGVPMQFALLSNLKYLDISTANLSGPLPAHLGNMTMLQTLLLFSNHFWGEIPVSYARLTALKSLDLSNNQLTGSIPEQFTSLKELTILSLMNNELAGEIPQGIGDLPNLDTLSLWNNSLTGTLPQNLGSNAKLMKLDVSSNFLTGSIPLNLCLGNHLIKLILFGNRLVSELPNSLANCTSLMRFRVQGNQLNGSIPYGFGQMPNLTYMDLSKNNQLPDNIWRAPSLQIFSASSSNIRGKIPDFIGCRSLYKIELQGNELNGSIPWDIGHCMKLLSLNLRDNSLTGIIPWEISTLPSITDYSRELQRLIQSSHRSHTVLRNHLPESPPVVVHRKRGPLRGVVSKPCAAGTEAATAEDVRQQPKKTAGAIVWIMAAAFGIGLFVLIAGSRCFRANYSRGISGEREMGPWKLTAFQRLNFSADDVVECISMTDKIIGMGSTGTVYKAEMRGGEMIAVKKLWGKQKETVRKRRGVVAEVDVLGNVRHRNIVRLLGWCSNSDSTMLLYEYMPNGSLDDLLHGKNKGDNLVADWYTRYKIALGVAQGICYLHHDCDPVIVHRDLKPSNILLDADMEARVADFGVAKLIQCDESMSVIAGSYGYIAPEYAYTLQVDEKSDIYSYGVVLLEILSGKRSVEGEFGEGNSIVDWVRLKIKNKNGVDEVLDKNAGASCPSVREEMMLLLRVALLCTSRNPADRPSMRDVVSMLQEAKPKRKLPASVGSGGAAAAAAATPLPQKQTVDC
ncbi:Leucine-rich repeat receptor-like protein kinase TDR [Vitis vinifera]|uniref:non-specific serine/threonine protein kinase n=1 Tax=Vitis vinifera TaxID=29760 RepID=A0A438DCG0_VITVI|nr:Leucine-rich repeat receptor-like protein kinase TDR [Vitis vinifera]